MNNEIEKSTSYIEYHESWITWFMTMINFASRFRKLPISLQRFIQIVWKLSEFIKGRKMFGTWLHFTTKRQCECIESWKFTCLTTWISLTYIASAEKVCCEEPGTDSSEDGRSLSSKTNLNLPPFGKSAFSIT